jgi:hypothetical protein
MMWLWISIIILTSILTYTLFAPFFLELNSETGLLRFRFHRLVSISLIIENESIKVLLKIGIWKKVIGLENRIAKRRQTKKTRSKLKIGRIPFTKVKAVLKSFKMNKFLINIDTGDMALNGMLYPIFLFIRNYSNRNLGINFVGKNTLILEIENNLGRMIWAYVSTRNK